MGEVWRATDTQLNRDVALKILPEAFATDPDRLARFQREAQVLASLNHPGIAAIYGIEEQDGTRALVLELVEGPTLADRISKGPIPLDEALPIAKQIAEALNLEAAHEAGVIQRLEARQHQGAGRRDRQSLGLRVGEGPRSQSGGRPVVVTDVDSSGHADGGHHGYCQVEENLPNRPPRYGPRVPTYTHMLGVRQPDSVQLDNTPRAHTGRGADAAQTRSQPKTNYQGWAWGKRELGVSALWGDLLLGWPAPRSAMLDPEQDDVNEIGLARIALAEAESGGLCRNPLPARDDH